MRTSPLLLVLALLCSTGQARAADWLSLSPELRELLQPIGSAWPSLAAEEARRIAASSERWLNADAQQREALRQRYQAWLEQPLSERAAARQRLLAWQALGDDQRNALRAAAQRVAALPQAQREALEARFRALPLEHRQAYLLPAAQRAAIALAQRLFPFVEPDQREATLQLLVDLGDAGRSQLERRARRMSATQRAALRGELLALPSESRLSFLGAE